LIKEISSEKETIWVIGNHDYAIEQYKYCGFLPRAYLVSSIEFDENGHKILILHGNQVCSHQNRSWANRICSRVNIWMLKHFGLDLQTWANTKCLYKKHVATLRQKVLKKYGEGVDTIIIGHTHLLGFSALNKTTLFDLGSAMKTKSYAIIDNGAVSIRLEH
jgi:predicted phosphodiesterase